MRRYAVAPTAAHEISFLAMVSDFERLDPANADFYAAARQDFRAYVKQLREEEQGLNLPSGWVPCTHRWIVSEDQVVGVARLRHNIETAFLSENGGHIGYDVMPSARGKGLGHFALRTALEEASRIGLRRTLLFTGETNAPSRAVIEAAGGVLESIGYSDFWSEMLCRYWIELPSGA